MNESMQPLATHVALLDECYRAFDFFNEFLAINIKSRVIINIASTNVKSDSTGRKGWFIADKWNSDGNIVSEINLSAEYGNLPYREILHTLLHQMAHLKNWEDGRGDGSNPYHSLAFKEAAELLGLDVEKSKSGGYSETSLGERALEAIDKFTPNESLFVFNRMLGESKKPTLTQIMVDFDTKDMVRELAELEGLPMKEIIFMLVLKAYDEANLGQDKNLDEDRDEEECEEESEKDDDIH